MQLCVFLYSVCVSQTVVLQTDLWVMFGGHNKECHCLILYVLHQLVNVHCRLRPPHNVGGFNLFFKYDLINLKLA